MGAFGNDPTACAPTSAGTDKAGLGPARRNTRKCRSFRAARGAGPTREAPVRSTLRLGRADKVGSTRDAPTRNAGADQALKTSARPRVSVPIGCQNSSEKRRNRRRSPVRRSRRCGRYAGIKRKESALRVCLPCRRSRFRVPSAASGKFPRVSSFRAFQLARYAELGGVSNGR
jgi:hypothetical protein